MAPIFVEEDIEKLIQAFPPLSLAGTRPTVVRSLSGHGLVDLASILKKFESMLEKEDSLLEISTLHSLLGVEKDAEQSILDQCSLQLYYSKDGRSLIPVSVADTIHQQLVDLARTSFVDISAFTARQDIALESIERWIKFDAGEKWQPFLVEEKRFLCSQGVRAKIETRIRQAIHEAGSEVCNVSASFDDEVQTPILQSLVETITKDQGGDVILDGAQVIYVPSEYSDAAEERYRQAQIDRVHLMTSELEDNRFCLIQLRDTSKNVPAGGTMDLDELEKAVRAKFEEWHAEGTQLRAVACSLESADPMQRQTRDSQAVLLVDSGILQHELGRLKATSLSLVENNFSRDGNYPEPAAIMETLNGTSVSPRPGLSRLILRSECVAELEEAVRDRIDELRHGEHVRLLQLLEARILAPFQLYTTGINTIIDATLRQHLEEFVFDHFRREVIPLSIKTAQDSNLLREKSSCREVEKLRQAVVDAKTLTALQGSVAKFTKKMKVRSTSADTIKTVWIRTMQQSIKSMKQMTRPSDILQHLIWILLAQQSGGLYMSSGKDTSRMIKQYESVGDAEMASRLSQWRNLLKAGQESKEDLQMMRHVATLTVEKMTAAE